MIEPGGWELLQQIEVSCELEELSAAIVVDYDDVHTAQSNGLVNALQDGYDA